MRRVIVLVLALSLVSGAMLAPASAKKKKKKPAPITFEASGSFAIANPADLNDAGVTRNEFIATCAVPATQGVDGYVVELSEEISKVSAQVNLSGSEASGLGHDLDLYFYDEACASTGSASTEAADEIGIFPAGTKWVVVTAFVGVELEFDLAATEIQL